MNGDTIALIVMFLIAALGLGAFVGYQLGFMAGRRSNAADFRTLAEHLTRDPESWTGA
jgi:membrane protein DedA with SNARE-associated domain